MSHAETESWARVTPGDVLRSIRRRIPSLILTTLLVSSIVVAVLVVWPSQYRSGGMMYVLLGCGALGGDPTANDESFNSDPMKINAGAEIFSRSIASQEEVSNGFSSVRPR